MVRGPAVAKGAVLGIVEDVPFAGIEYVPGRTLDRLFSGEGQGSIPLPVEHALLIAEKLLVALEAGKPFEKKMGAPARLPDAGLRLDLQRRRRPRLRRGPRRRAPPVPQEARRARRLRPLHRAGGPRLGQAERRGRHLLGRHDPPAGPHRKGAEPRGRHRRPLRSGPRRRREPDAGGPRQAPRPGPREGPGPARDGRRRLQEDPRQAPLRRPLRPFDVQPRLLHAPALREGDRKGAQGAGAGRDDRPEAARSGRGEEGQGSPRPRPGRARGGGRRPPVLRRRDLAGHHDDGRDPGLEEIGARRNSRFPSSPEGPSSSSAVAGWLLFGRGGSETGRPPADRRPSRSRRRPRCRRRLR